MRNKKLTGYGLIAFCLIVLLSVPPKKMHRTRAKFVAFATNLYSKHDKETKLTRLETELKKLQEENASLKQKLLNPQLYPQMITAHNVAQVIFRDPAFWASSVLINKGMKDEDSYVEKNSPVLSNGYLIGIVEEVFDTFSKVRLITDKNLQFSIKKKQSQDLTKDGPIEVGTLCGISSVDNRYRFKNVEGHFFAPTLKPGDELVTSGLDGLFPEGLQVAVVTDVKINEEEVIFPFKAIVTAPDIKDLKLVTVLKPISSH
jgi:rod shape-determining protein MreC